VKESSIQKRIPIIYHTFGMALLKLSRPLCQLSRTAFSKQTTRPLIPSHPYSTHTLNDHILTLSCPDRPGIVHAVTGVLATASLNIQESQQASINNQFFMRVHFGQNQTTPPLSTASLSTAFSSLATEMSMDLTLRPVAQKPKLLILVSKQLHCLADLLFRQSSGQLPVEIPLVISNHPDAAALAASYGVPYHHLPVTPATKQEQEQQILRLIEQNGIDFVVLARYMQVLSPTLTQAMPGRVINIHHSFLPSFKGAKPYHQAYERGVKLIGATAHFVTDGLDEGPIIEQRVSRVDHSMTPKQLTAEGGNVEVQVLGAAVKLVAESRVLVNGNKTVVFS
jgi:formyltetrahydrofolate deformylase